MQIRAIGVGLLQNAQRQKARPDPKFAKFALTPSLLQVCCDPKFADPKFVPSL
jgi:hypothetical protein